MNSELMKAIYKGKKNYIINEKYKSMLDRTIV